MSRMFRVSAAGAHVAIEASGAFDDVDATRLPRVEEMVEAMERANDFADANPGI
jgi:hypothetical protein